MADPVGAISAPNAAQYTMAVTRQEHDQQKVEGQQAVQLIDSATAPKLADAGPVGTKLNFVA